MYRFPLASLSTNNPSTPPPKQLLFPMSTIPRQRAGGWMTQSLFGASWPRARHLHTRRRQGDRSGRGTCFFFFWGGVKCETQGTFCFVLHFWGNQKERRWQFWGALFPPTPPPPPAQKKAHTHTRTTRKPPEAPKGHVVHNQSAGSSCPMVTINPQDPHARWWLGVSLCCGIS